jgi:hypothetical protein
MRGDPPLPKLSLQIMQFTINSENQNPAAPVSGQYVFTFTLPLPEGQASEAWEPSNDVTPLLSPTLLQNKPFPTSPTSSPTLLPFILTSLSLSLSLMLYPLQ